MLFPSSLPPQNLLLLHGPSHLSLASSSRQNPSTLISSPTRKVALLFFFFFFSMGQSQSRTATEDRSIQKSPIKESQPPSMEDLIAEATAFGDDGNESLDEKAQKALECPCVAELRTGPCGMQFSEAFVCFFKSTAEEKGSDCMHPFIALQNCIKANPNAFSKDILDQEEHKKEEEDVPDPEYRILAPSWAKEPKPKV